ncbi:leucine-rich repeat domain-containing protein [Butyricicoccus pullicaecorum]|nr:leucine-rich repeat domain-containing protein [Butyricicoccus pullicaecorum]
MITDCNESATGELVIPSELEGKPVVKIGSSAFLNCSSLTSVMIPDGVPSIGINSFYNCSRLKRVTIPASVTKIEWGAFSGCSQLTDIYDKGDEDAWKQIAIGIRNSFEDVTKHDNSQDPDKDPVNVTVPRSQYQFHVVDHEGTSLSGVQMTYAGQTGTTAGQTVDTPINLQFAENPVNKEWKLSLIDSNRKHFRGRPCQMSKRVVQYNRIYKSTREIEK